MSRGPHPVLMILGLILPTAAGALGLGEISVDSALNEPLSAQIEIVGASAEDLMSLKAVIAGLDTFQRYGAERPAFLNSTTFKIGQDLQGRPVLEVRSRDSFTDPLVSLLVDVKWRTSELVREFPLLLDPAGLSAARRVSAVAQAATMPAPDPPAPATVGAAAEDVVPAVVLASHPNPTSPTSARVVDAAGHHRISSHDTLRSIARRTGARSETQIQRLMIATFRANPGAFEGNINRLHRGALLDLPTVAQVDAISAADARHTVEEQMAAWRVSSRGTNPAQHPALPAPAPPPAAATVAAREVGGDPNDGELSSRLQSLERQLSDLHRQMADEFASMQELRKAADRATAVQPATASQPAPAAQLAAAAQRPAAAPVTSAHPNLLLGAAALLLTSALGGYGYLRRRLQRPPPQLQAPPAAAAENSPAIVADPDLIARADAPVSAAVASRSTPTPRAPVASPSAPHWPPVTARNETGIAIEVDAEALERSYLESLGFNTATFGEGAVPTGEFRFAPTNLPAAGSPAAGSPADAATVESTASPGTLASLSAEIDMLEIEETEMDATDVNTAVLNAEATTRVVPVALVSDEMATAIDPAASMTTELDFNLSNLDATAEHVQMPSALHDHAQVSEARTNIVDVLKMAIDRDPHRRDLRMKLVETYYNAALGNRRAFMDVARKLAREREFLSPEDWNKVVRMGRDLAPDDILFNDLAKDDDDVAAA